MGLGEHLERRLVDAESAAPEYGATIAIVHNSDFDTLLGPLLDDAVGIITTHLEPTAPSS